MDAPHEEQQSVSFFATDKLAGARAAILSGASALLVARAQVEKHRKTDTDRAADAYTELQKVRNYILNALTDAQMALLELEEYPLAKKATLSAKGLAGFNLLSNVYKPVYEALIDYADGLSQTVQARQMRRPSDGS